MRPTVRGEPEGTPRRAGADSSGRSGLPADEYGSPSPTAVVLLHDGVVNRRMWRGIAEPISRRHYTIAPDLPGHGERRGEIFDVERAARGLRELLGSREVTEVILVGESLGGFVALEVAAGSRSRSHAAPEPRIRGLLLSGCTFNPVGRTGLGLRVYAALAAAALRLLGAGRLRSLTDGALRRAYPRAPHDAILELGLAPGPSTEAVRALLGRDYLARAERCHAPTLILNGSRDPLGRWGERAFADRMPRARTRRMRGVGHAAALARPTEFTRILLGYLARGMRDEEDRGPAGIP